MDTSSCSKTKGIDYNPFILFAVIVLVVGLLFISFQFVVDHDRQQAVAQQIHILPADLGSDGNLDPAKIQKYIHEIIARDLQATDARIGDIWSSIQAIGLITSIIGVLITVLVLYFSFANSSQINNAIQDIDQKSKDINGKLELLSSKLKKEMRESSIDFRMEMERKITEEDQHQKAIETKLGKVSENLQMEIQALRIETSLQKQMMENRFQEYLKQVGSKQTEVMNQMAGMASQSSKDDSKMNQVKLDGQSTTLPPQTFEFEISKDQKQGAEEVILLNADGTKIEGKFYLIKNLPSNPTTGVKISFKLPESDDLLSKLGKGFFQLVDSPQVPSVRTFKFHRVP